LKSIYKPAAKDAIVKYPSWKACFEALVNRGLEPEVVGVAVARKISAISLILWKKRQRYDSKVALM
jgi:hypothetical protein